MAGQPGGRPAAVQVQGSPNGEEWTDLASAGAQAEQELSFPGASFRYYRLRFTGDGGVAVSRWRLFTGEAQEILLSQGKTATSSGDTPGYEASKAVDGSWNAWDSVWISADAAAPHWLMVDLGESRTFQEFRLYTCGGEGLGEPWYRPLAFQVQVSGDAADWQTVWDARFDDGEAARTNLIAHTLSAPATARYVRLTITDPKESWVPSPCARIPEFQVIELRSNYTELPLVPEENAWQDAIPAPVPGSVHTALYENGVIPDPFDAQNDAVANAQSQRPGGTGPPSHTMETGEAVRRISKGCATGRISGSTASKSASTRACSAVPIWM